MWWVEISVGSERDDYCCWTLRIRYNIINGVGPDQKIFFLSTSQKMKFKESAIAHKYLDGLRGIEIGGSAHNPFGVNALNVDYTDDMNTVFKEIEYSLCGEKLGIDIVAHGDELPIKSNAMDFVINSHVVEHFFDPIKAMKEWYRIVKTGGYIFVICPHADRVKDENRPITTLKELNERHTGIKKKKTLRWV